MRKARRTYKYEVWVRAADGAWMQHSAWRLHRHAASAAKLVTGGVVRRVLREISL